MILLYALVEGVSEETFVREVLAPHLAAHNVYASAILVTTNRRLGRAGKGGLTRFARVREDLSRLMSEKAGSQFRFTTMFDLYRLPIDFPGSEAASSLECGDRAEKLQTALAEEFGDDRLIPHLQIHEFESLILADFDAIQRMFPGQEKAIASLRAVVENAGGPENVNDTEPPSKRIARSLPAYSKVLATTLMASFSSLPLLREGCPHFNAWVDRLEKLGREGDVG